MMGGSKALTLVVMKPISSIYDEYVMFVESKALRGRSKAEYLRQVRKLAGQHPETPLEELSEREVFDHLIGLRDRESLRASTLNQARVALRLFYGQFLGLRWKLWDEFKIRRDRPLPVVAAREEIARVLGAARAGRFRAILTLIYHCGLRVGEAVRLRPMDIDAARSVVRVVDGKGGKAREVPIAHEMIERLRVYWKSHGNRRWLFPGVGRQWRDRGQSLREAMGGCEQPMSVSSVQAALRMIVAAARVKKAITCHSLRHSFATHMLEGGVSLRQVSAYLGHASVASTLIYLHVTEISESKGREAQAVLLEAALRDLPRPPATPGKSARRRPGRSAQQQGRAPRRG